MAEKNSVSLIKILNSKKSKMLTNKKRKNKEIISQTKITYKCVNLNYIKWEWPEFTGYHYSVKIDIPDIRLEYKIYYLHGKYGAMVRKNKNFENTVLLTEPIGADLEIAKNLVTMDFKERLKGYSSFHRKSLNNSSLIITEKAEILD